jgi:hypothetical protein
MSATVLFVLRNIDLQANNAQPEKKVPSLREQNSEAAVIIPLGAGRMTRLFG